MCGTKPESLSREEGTKQYIETLLKNEDFYYTVDSLTTQV